MENYEDTEPIILSVGEEDEVTIKAVAEVVLFSAQLVPFFSSFFLTGTWPPFGVEITV